MIAGAFFSNLGGFQFQERTDEVGLSSLNWNYHKWCQFFGCDDTPGAIQFYMSSVAWGDFNNDGNVDFILCDRHENPARIARLRNVLYLNNGSGQFVPQTTDLSGLDTNTESIEAADLDGDGLLDLVSGVQVLNSIGPDKSKVDLLPLDRQYTKVYYNMGAMGGRANHWLEVQLAGQPAAALIGAQLTLDSDGSDGPRFLGRRDYFSTEAYKASRPLLAHWGLGGNTKATVHIRLPNGDVQTHALPCVDHRLTVDTATGDVTGCGSTGGN
jgi:hypothetical protein